MPFRSCGYGVHTKSAAVPLRIGAVDHTVNMSLRTGFDELPARRLGNFDRLAHVLIGMIRHEKIALARDSQATLARKAKCPVVAFSPLNLLVSNMRLTFTPIHPLQEAADQGHVLAG